MNSYQPDTQKAQYCYLDLYTDTSIYPCQGIECYFESTALRVLKSRAKFAHFAFLSRTRAGINSLMNLITPLNISKHVGILSGDPNNVRTLTKLLDSIPRSASSLVFMDPAGYRRLHWSTLTELAARGKNWQGQKMDFLIIFPLEMALLRNLMRPECEKSITRFYGNQRWEDIKRQNRIRKLSSTEIKTRLIELFKTGLFELGYRYVEDFQPAAPTHDPYYHLIFASDRSSRLKYIRDAWGKPRYLRCELLYDIQVKKSK